MLAWLRNLIRPVPPPEHSVEGIGMFRFEAGIWTATVDDGGWKLLLGCDDDPLRPNAAALARLCAVWRNRERSFSVALRFQQEREPDPEQGAGRSTPYGIWIENWEDADCVVELLGPDEETVWRIGFRDKMPRWHAFDH